MPKKELPVQKELDSVAKQKYQKKWDQLTKEQKDNVLHSFFSGSN